MSIQLSIKTLEKVKVLFAKPDIKIASDLLVSECGNNLPFCENETPESMERIRFAVIKLSNGKIKELNEAIKLAQVD